MRHFFNRFLLMGVLSLSLVACASNVADEDAAATVFPFVRLSPSAPPQAPFEERLAPEEPLRQIWRKGYWDYDGKEFVWVPGHFIYRPDPTASWTSDRWEKRSFGWAFVPGFWQ